MGWIKTMPRQARAGVGRYGTRCTTVPQGESLDVAETFNGLKFIMPRFFDSGRCQRRHEVEPGISLWAARSSALPSPHERADPCAKQAPWHADHERQRQDDLPYVAE